MAKGKEVGEMFSNAECYKRDTGDHITKIFGIWINATVQEW